MNSTRRSSRELAVVAIALSSLGAVACSGDGSGLGAAANVGGNAQDSGREYGDARAGGGTGTGGTGAGGSGRGGTVGGGGAVDTGGAFATGGATGSGGTRGADAGGKDATGGNAGSGSDADGGPLPDAHSPDGTVTGDGAIPPLTCNGPGPRFATRVTDEAFGPGQNLGRDQLPGIVLGPPKGTGSAQGSTTDVASLGNGGSITLAFDENAIVDGQGADFIVFENAFNVSGNPNNPYAELGTVAVSNDGTTWTSFPCTATAYPYDGCAGWHPVYANADTNTIDPTDPTVAGGDAFDLAAIGASTARFVRITDRADLATIFDLDAVAIVHGQCN